MKDKIKFYKHEYPPSHWSINYTEAGTGIATITVRNKYHFSVILNPGDCRGYRSIIRYLNEGDSSLSSAFNRTYSLSEQRAINDVTAIMAKVYEKLGVIVQFSQLGNNSHHFDRTSRVTEVGDDDEPSLLHLHMWGRGDPVVEYIPGVPLRGPEPGEMFDLMSQKKRPNQNELLKCLTTFKNLLNDYIKSPEFIEEFGDSIKVSFDSHKSAQQEKENIAPRPGFFASAADLELSAPPASKEPSILSPRQ